MLGVHRCHDLFNQSPRPPRLARLADGLMYRLDEVSYLLTKSTLSCNSPEKSLAWVRMSMFPKVPYVAIPT